MKGKIEHLAQVFLDGELAGRPLEGSLLKNTIPYLHEFLIKIQNDQWDDKNALSQLLVTHVFQNEDVAQKIKLFENMQDLVKLEKKLESLANNIKEKFRSISSSNKTDDIKEYVAGIKDSITPELKTISLSIIRRYKESGDSFFPGGYAGRNGSHQMIYRLKKENNGRASFLVYNTGSGLNYHDCAVHPSGKTSYYPCYGFSVPENLDEEKWMEVISQLLKVQVLPLIDLKHFSYTVSDVYENILTKGLYWLDGTVIPGADLSAAILGQRDGTCVFKAVQQVIRCHFKQPSNSYLFFFSYRMFLLENECHEISLKGKTYENDYENDQVSGYKKILQQSLANLARTLDSHLKPHVKNWAFDKTTIRTINEKLYEFKEIIATLETIKIKHIEYKPRAQEIKAEYSKDTSVTFDKPIFNSMDIQKQKTINNGKKSRFDSDLFETESFIKALSRVKSCIESLSPQDSEHQICNYIEKFCFRFSDLTKTLLHKPCVEIERNEIMEKLSFLLNQYEKYRPKPTPRSVITYLSLVCIIDRLCEQGLFTFNKIKLSCIPLYGAEIADFFKRLKKNPFLSTGDVRLDLQWQRLQEFYKNVQKKYRYNPNCEQRIIDYYSSIIDNAPESERESLKKCWKDEQLRLTPEKKEIINNASISPSNINFLIKLRNAIYFKGERVSLLENFKNTTEAFDFQSKIEIFIQKCHSKIMNHSDSYHKRIIKKKMNIGMAVTNCILLFDIVMSDFDYNKESKGDLNVSFVINPRLRENFPNHENKKINTTLIDDMDGNAYSSQEIPFHPKSAFSSKKFISSKERFKENDSYQTRSFVSKDERQMTMLRHLRISPSCQVIALLSELYHGSFDLAEASFQQYIMLTVFQPGALLAALNSHSDLWTILKKLMDKNQITTNSYSGRIEETFLIKLAGLMSSYAMDAHKEKIIILDKHQLSHVLSHQMSMLDYTKSQLTTDLPLIEQRELYNLKLNVFMHANFMEENANSFEEMLYAYLMVALLPRPTEDINFAAEEALQASLAKSYDYLIKPLASNSIRENCLSKTIVKIISQLRPDANNSYKLKLTKLEFPNIKLVDNNNGIVIDVDFSVPNIMYNGMKLAYLPLRFFLSSEYYDEFSTKSVLALVTTTQAYTCYEWESDAHEYRLLDKNDSEKNENLFYLQRKVNAHWYSLTAPTKKMATALGFQHYAYTEKVPRLFEQASYRIWIADRQKYFIVDKNTGNTCYESVTELTKCGFLSGKIIVDEDTQGHQLLSCFEDVQFIEHIKIEQGILCWHMPRYNLTVIQGDKEDTFLTIDKKYSVKPLTDRLNTFTTGLILSPIDNKEEKEVYIVPIQPFYTPLKHKKPIACGTYYVWTHDFSNSIAQKAKLGSNDQVSTRGLGWNYQNNECYARFTIENGLPIARSPVDQIYLAYLYLVQDRPKQAYKLLKDCQFQGSADEIKYLWWIIKKLPEAHQENVKPVVNSRVLAVQMRAMYIIINLKNQFPIVINSLSCGQHDSNTHYFRTIEQRKLKNFFESIEEPLALLYEVYDNRLNNIPSYMRLTVEQKSFLLSYYQAKWELDHASSESGQPKYQGIMGKHYLHLFGPSNTQDDMSTNHITRTKNLGKLNVQLAINDKLSDIGESREEADKVLIYPEEEIFPCLSPYMEINLAKKYVASYYKIAISQAAEHQKHKNKIQSFCKAIIQSCNSHTNLENGYDFLSIANKLWQALPNGKPPELSYTNTRLSYRKETVVVKQDTVITKRQLLNKDKGKNEFDLIQYPGALKLLRCELLKIQKKYIKFKTSIIKEIQQASKKTFDEQVFLFDKLDTCLLMNKNKFENEQRKLYLDYCSNRKVAKSDLEQLNDQQIALSRDKNAKASEINAILERRQGNEIAELGKQVVIPTLEYLIGNFSALTHHDYIKMGCSENDATNLETKLLKFFCLDDAERRLDKLRTAINENLAKNTQLTQLQVVKALVSKNQSTLRSEIILQYIKKISLRPEQATMLAMLVKANRLKEAASYVYQMIMGGGKTKFILPLLLYLLADGEHIPVAMVPEASLKINYFDLRDTSTSCFGQNPFLLRFDRNTESEPALLRKLYESVLITLKQKNYIVTSPSCIQSIELKFIEVLFYRQTYRLTNNSVKLEETNKQRYWLMKILKLFRENGIGVADECHQLYHVFKELNYAIGEEQAISSDIADTMSCLFAWIDSLDSIPGCSSFVEIIHDPSKVANEKSMNKQIDYYITMLCDNPPDWVEDLIVEKLSFELFKRYLRGETSDKEDAAIYQQLKNYRPIKVRWLLLRESFMVMLPFTLKKKLNEDYGSAPKKRQYPFAIPFRSNNTPTPYVFGGFLPTMNYTAQMLYHDGVPIAWLKNILSYWKNQARSAIGVHNQRAKQLQEQFNYLFKGFDQGKTTLLTLDLSNEELMARLHKEFHKDPLLIKYILKEIYYQLTIDSAVLRSNSLNLADMFRSNYLFSGMPSNYRSYHSKIHLAYETTLLVVSQIFEYLALKNAQIIPIDFCNPVAKLESMLANSSDNLRALIDGGGLMCGLSNVKVANKIADYYRKNQDPLVLSYVLFYQEDTLYALNISKPQSPLIRLVSTDAASIQQALNGCPAENRFTYYDQEHTLGSDITQFDKASAIVTANIKTGISELAQSIMRMRGMGLEQEVVIYLNKNILLDHKQSQPVTRKKLKSIVTDIELESLRTQHFQASLKEISHLFRHDLLCRMLQVKNINSIDRLFERAKNFFIEFQTDDVISLFEEKIKKTDTPDILQKYGKVLLKKWKTVLTDLGIDDINSKKEELKIKIHSICEEAQRICSKTQLYRPQHSYDNLLKEQEINQEKNINNELVNKSQPRTIKIRRINFDWIKKINQYTFDQPNITGLKQINRLVVRYKQPWAFDTTIYASHDFLYTYNEQDVNNIFNVYFKLTFAVLFTVNSSNQLVAVVICMEEAEKLHCLLASEGMEKNYLLSTIGGSLQAGKLKLSSSQQDQFKRLIEQIALFTGRVDVLLQLKTYEWFLKNINEKMNFFQEVVQSHTLISKATFENLESKFFNIQNYIRQRAKYRNFSNEIINSTLKKASDRIKDRLGKIFNCLKKIDESINKYEIIDVTKYDLVFADYPSVEAYQTAFLLLNLLDNQMCVDAARLLIERSDDIICKATLECLSKKFITVSMPNSNLKLTATEQIKKQDSVELSFVNTLIVDNISKTAFINLLLINDRIAAGELIKQQQGSVYCAIVEKLIAQARRNFSRADFSNIDWSGFDFTGINIQNTKLAGSTLSNVILAEDSLIGTTLDRNTVETVYKQGYRNFSKVNLVGIDLSGLNLSETNFTGANLTGANLIGTNLKQSNLTESLLDNTNLCKFLIADATVGNNSLSGAKLDREAVATLYVQSQRDFSNTDLSAGNFSFLILDNAIFNQVNACGVNFNNSHLIGCVFKGATLRNVCFDNAKLENISLAGAKLDRITVQSLYAQGHRDFSNVDLSGEDLSGLDLSGVDFSGAILKGANLRKAILRNLTLNKDALTGVKLDCTTLAVLYSQGHRNFSNTDLSNGDLSGLMLNGSDFSGALFNGTNLRNVSLVNVTFSMNSIKNSKLDGPVIQSLYQQGHRNFSSTDLSNQNLASLNLNGSNLSLANVSETTLASTDLTNCTLNGTDLRKIAFCDNVILGSHSLAGAKLDLTTVQSLYAQGHRDFSNTNLSDADLSGLNLRNANFTGANLVGAILTNTNLKNTTVANVAFSDNTFVGAIINSHIVRILYARGYRNFSKANLESEDLTGFDLRGVNFKGASLASTNFKNADLRNTSFEGAKFLFNTLAGATLDRNAFKVLYKHGYRDFSKVNLHGGDLSGLDLSEANFTGADLTGVKLDNTNLSEVTLKDATLKNVSLINTKLDWPTIQKFCDRGHKDFSNADLSGQDFSNQVLTGLNLSGANLEKATLKNTTFTLKDMQKMGSLKDIEIDKETLEKTNNFTSSDIKKLKKEIATGSRNWIMAIENDSQKNCSEKFSFIFNYLHRIQTDEQHALKIARDAPWNYSNRCHSYRAVLSYGRRALINLLKNNASFQLVNEKMDMKHLYSVFMQDNSDAQYDITKLQQIVFNNHNDWVRQNIDKSNADAETKFSKLVQHLNKIQKNLQQILEINFDVPWRSKKVKKYYNDLLAHGQQKLRALASNKEFAFKDDKISEVAKNVFFGHNPLSWKERDDLKQRMVISRLKILKSIFADDSKNASEKIIKLLTTLKSIQTNKTDGLKLSRYTLWDYGNTDSYALVINYGRKLIAQLFNNPPINLNEQQKEDLFSLFKENISSFSTKIVNVGRHDNAKKVLLDIKDNLKQTTTSSIRNYTFFCKSIYKECIPTNSMTIGR